MTGEELDAIRRKRNEIIKILLTDNAFCNSVAMVIDKLIAGVERLTLERDAAVTDLREAIKYPGASSWVCLSIKATFYVNSSS